MAPERHARLRQGVQAAVACSNTMLGAERHRPPRCRRRRGARPRRRPGVRRRHRLRADARWHRRGHATVHGWLASPGRCGRRGARHRCAGDRRTRDAGDHPSASCSPGAAAQKYATEIGLQPAAPNALVTASMAQWQAARNAAASSRRPKAVASARLAARQARQLRGRDVDGRHGVSPRRCDQRLRPCRALRTWADEDCAVSTSGGEALFRRCAFAPAIAGEGGEVIALNPRRGQGRAQGSQEARAERHRRRDHGQQGQLGRAADRPRDARRVGQTPSAYKIRSGSR